MVGLGKGTPWSQQVPLAPEFLPRPRRDDNLCQLQQHSASSYSVNASVGHTPTVRNSDVEDSLSQTSAVIYSDTDLTETLFVFSDSEEHTSTAAI
jgi:hypothetical protein